MMQELFPFTPCPLFTTPVTTKEEALELVNEHVPWLSKKQRLIPLLGLDATGDHHHNLHHSIQSLRENILSEQYNVHGRDIHRVVKGKGAGKTRCLDEVLQAFLLDNHHASAPGRASSFVLPLPVTFGSNWTLTSAEIGAARGNMYHKPSFVITARMLSVFFAMPLKDASDLLARLPMPYDSNNHMVAAVVRHIMSSLQLATNRPVDGLLVLLDEASNYNLLRNRPEDPLQQFRFALLGPTTDLDHCGLLMSAVEKESVCLFHRRGTRQFWLPGELVPQEVVEKIWLPGIAAIPGVKLTIPAGLAEEDMALLATSLARIPLHVELYLDCLRAVIEHQGHPQVELSKAMLCEAFDALLRQLQEPYAGQQTNRSAARQKAAMEIIKATVLQAYVNYDTNEVKFWLHNGFLTNEARVFYIKIFGKASMRKFRKLRLLWQP